MTRPSSAVVPMVITIVESIVADGSVFKEVWNMVEVNVVVLVLTVPVMIFREHAVLRIVGLKGCKGVGVTRPLMAASAARRTSG